MRTAGAAVATFEWARMVMIGKHPHRLLTRVAAAATGISTLTTGMHIAPDGYVITPVSSFFFLVALTFLVFLYNHFRKGPHFGQLMLGMLYVGFAMSVMIWIRNGSANGLYHMLTALFIVWASDISAYFAGKAIGGPKLAPKISPKKTWAGFFGSSVGAGLVAAGLACPDLRAHFGVHTAGDMGMWAYGAMGFVLGAVGQAGDLFKSIFKRHYGIKDMGTLIPGHGGLFDRIDALLLVALAFGMILMMAGA
jgi:phosphatidate cytidylyltransferase